MAKHSHYCLGTAETQEKEKVNSGVVHAWDQMSVWIRDMDDPLPP